MHQAPGPNPFTRAVRSVPDWDGPRGAEKIQVELTRPDVTETGHSTSPTPKDESSAEPMEISTIGAGTDAPGRTRSDRACYNCRALGHKQSQCPQLTTLGRPELDMRPPFCYHCMKPGHTVGTCQELSANEESKPSGATARRRRARRTRGVAAPPVMRACSTLGPGSTIQPMQIHRMELTRVELTPQMNTEGDVLKD